MGRKAKKSSVKKRKKGVSGKRHVDVLPQETIGQLLNQKEEIEALLASLEDAYNEATILEEDYEDIKKKNLKRLEEINRKIEMLKSKPASAPAPVIPASRSAATPPVTTPAAAPKPEITPRVVVEKKKKEVKHVSPEDLKKLEEEISERFRSMVEEVGARVTEKDVVEIKSTFTKFETEIERMKAMMEALKEGKKVLDEKIQRVTEGLAEIRTMVYGREATAKEWEVKIEKIMDVMNRLEPEKLIVELGKRDKEINDINLKITKLEETNKEFGEMLRRIEKIMRDIGSLENVVKISNEASEKLMNMQTIERNNQKMLEKIQGIYAELSKRMEEFMLYRAKQDRMEDLLNDVLKNLDDINTKIAHFVTKEDLESLRMGMGTAPLSATEEGEDLNIQKEEIKTLLKSIEEEFRSGVITKEEYEKAKKANLEKLKEIEKRMTGAENKGGAGEEKPAPVKPVPEEKTPERKEREEALLKDLEETFKKGFISKEAYEKTKKMILGKGE